MLLNFLLNTQLCLFKYFIPRKEKKKQNKTKKETWKQREESKVDDLNAKWTHIQKKSERSR